VGRKHHAHHNKATIDLIGSPPWSSTTVTSGFAVVANNTEVTLATGAINNGTTIWGNVSPRGTTPVHVHGGDTSATPGLGSASVCMYKNTTNNEHELRWRHRVNPAASLTVDYILGVVSP